MTGPSVFGLPHLSEDAVAAFADGVLSASATIRARRHCAECAECADAVRGQREAAMMLRTAGAPALPAGLLDRLAGLPMSAQLPPPLSGLPTTVDSDGVPVFIAYQPGPARSDQPDRPGQSRRKPEPAGRSAIEREPARPAHRRVLLPVSILASAAAVLAAGAIGGTVGSFQSTIEQPPAVNLAPGLANVQQPANSSPPVGTGPSFAAVLGGPLIQPVSLQSGFVPAPLRPMP
ncbi:MAG TPA: hypothetical protein VFD94_03985 [Jatrophihabitans sp.]|nr:hypothetical protein [Jatrophihabitans sp.]